jgi:hypothetical protein
LAIACAGPHSLSVDVLVHFSQVFFGDTEELETDQSPEKECKGHVIIAACSCGAEFVMMSEVIYLFFETLAPSHVFPEGG